MRWNALTVALRTSRWRRVVPGLAVALLLMPTPALALTFLTPWSTTFTQTGGPTPPTPIVNDSVNGQDDHLTVDMGNYTGSTAVATSTVQLTRQIQVTSASQAIQYAHAAGNTFQQAGETVTVVLKNASGSTTLSTPISVSFTNNSTIPVTFSDSETVRNTLNNGTYTLVVTVTHKTNNKLGSWKKKSQHVFDFAGF
jgi:hypothetical protein